MDAVLGLSVTPTSVGLVLVGGQDVDGVTLEGDGFEVRRPATAVQTSERAAAAVRRSEALAADHGRRVHSIGVTWSDDADTEATLLLKSLSDSGFDNIVPVRLSEATDALARRIAQMLDFQTTAVCVIEPEQIIALVATDDGAVQTAVNHSVVTEDDLVGWLSSVFARADWAPEALVLVGSAEDLDGLLPVLEDALDVPVFSPDEAQLALARGAALACAQPPEFGGWDEPIHRTEPEAGRARFSRVGPVAMLAAGVVTFVASVSVAVAMQLAPEHPAPQPRPAAEMSTQLPAAPRPVPFAPAPVAPPAEVVVPEAAPVVEEAPVWEPPPAPEQAPIVEGTLPGPAVPAAAPPAVLPPPAVIPPAPQERPGILQRIRDRFGGNDDAPAPVVPAAPVAPAAPVVPPPVPPVFPGQ